MINILHIKSHNFIFRTPKVDSAGFIMTGKNNGGLKYGGFVEKTAKFNPP